MSESCRNSYVVARRSEWIKLRNNMLQHRKTYLFEKCSWCSNTTSAFLTSNFTIHLYVGTCCKQFLRSDKFISITARNISRHLYAGSRRLAVRLTADVANLVWISHVLLRLQWWCSNSVIDGDVMRSVKCKCLEKLKRQSPYRFFELIFFLMCSTFQRNQSANDVRSIHEELVSAADWSVKEAWLVLFLMPRSDLVITCLRCSAAQSCSNRTIFKDSPLWLKEVGTMESGRRGNFLYHPVINYFGRRSERCAVGK